MTAETMTDEEIAFARGDAERDLPGGMADHVLRLCDAITEARRERDDLTRKLEEACAAEQRAAIRAGEWMQRVDEARRQVATARRETAIALQCVSILRSENLQLVAQWERTFGAGER